MLKWWLNRTYTRLGLLIHFLYIINKVKKWIARAEKLMQLNCEKSADYFSFLVSRLIISIGKLFFFCCVLLNIYFCLNLVLFAYYVCNILNYLWISKQQKYYIRSPFIQLIHNYFLFFLFVIVVFHGFLFLLTAILSVFW